MMLTAKQAQLYLEQAIELNTQCKYADALALLEQAAPVFETAEDWEGVVKSVNLQSDCLRRSGNYDEAMSKAEYALQICLAKFGEQHPDTANSYHNLGLCFYSKGEYEQAIHYYQLSLHIRLATLGEQHPETAKSYNNLGNLHFSKGNYNQTISLYKKALDIRLTTIGEQHSDTANNYNNLGSCYYAKGDYDQAITYQQKALAMLLAILDKQNLDTASCYNNMGLCYYAKSDFNQAMTYQQQALNIRLTSIGEQHPHTTESYNNLGICYYAMGDYNQAITLWQQSLSIRLVILGEQSPSTANNYNNLGVCYIDIGDFEQAIRYLQQALTIRLAALGEQHLSTAMSYTNLGYCLTKKGAYYEAINYHQKASDIYLKLFGKLHPDAASNYGAFAQCYQAQAQYRQALHYYGQALQALALSVPDEDYYLLPTLEGYNSAVVLLKTLSAKSGALHALYTHEQNPKNLIAAIAHYHCADELIGQMRYGYKTQGSKVHLAEKSKTTVYDAGLEALYMYEQLASTNATDTISLSGFNTTLGYHLPDRPIDLAFLFSEKSKAVLLFANLKDAEARIAAQLPPDLVQQEYHLRIELTYLERRMSEEGFKKPEEQDQAALKEWQNLHFDYKYQYDALIERLETEYPQYHALKYNTDVATITQIQAALPPKVAMLSYVLTEKHLYAFIITAKNSHWLQTTLPAGFEGLVEDFLYHLECVLFPFGC
ncbi:MAG TPA: tetratricopeptide repeat protein [Chitinophagales bacterium]|nr:tetratricopeptide repeat protein [Chitinophagales bacterium]HRK27879.1 tetratricopeptide repeat protein [Chitinophagales bacterium]